MEPKKKTYKREVALVILLWFAYIVETKDVEVVNILAFPIFTFVFGAFGLDFWGKQLRQGQPFIPTGVRGSEHSSQYPSGTDK